MAEAIAIKNGKITAVGDSKAIMSMSGENTRKINLNGKTLVPGFIDAHSHLSGVAVQVGTANLLPPPDGPVQNIAALQQTLREFMATSDMVKQHSVVIGFNYDDSQLEEARHPNRQELDAVSTEMPIMITHQSGHIGVYNTKALEMFVLRLSQSIRLEGLFDEKRVLKNPMESSKRTLILPLSIK